MIKKAVKAIRNPEKVNQYIETKIYRDLRPLYHEYIANRGASVYESSNFNSIPTDAREGIRAAKFDELEMSRTDVSQFREYLKIRDYAHHFDCESVLEIGAGLSTAIWADYGKQTDATVTSIDADFDRFQRWIVGTSHERTIEEQVHKIDGISIQPDDLVAFYSEPQAELGGVAVSQFASEIERFARAEGCPVDILSIINEVATDSDWRVQDLLISPTGLYFPEELLDWYVKDSNSFDALVTTLETADTTGVLDRLDDPEDGWDLVWFDSGEVSSMVEWNLLKERISPGGIAAFHDVFFPKSMKNFLVGASLLCDSEWRILLVDDTTRQGLLIAQRLPD